MAPQATDRIHITRDHAAGGAVMGFEIQLGPEGTSVFMPFSSIENQMPDQDRALLKADASAFLRRYGRVMIATARQRFAEGALGSPEDLERFEATERMRKDVEEFDPEKAAVLASLRSGGVHGGVRA